MILLVDDEAAIRRWISADLAGAGYVVRIAVNGETAVREFVAARPDLVLLDVMMPGLDGYATCEELRKFDRDVPIVFLSAIDREEDQIRGLRAGGDDYVSKTASNAMLFARIEKALERAARFSTADAPTSMTKTEADIYRVLKSERGRYFSYREIFAAICGEGYYADEGAIRSHISRLRGKLPPGEGIVAKRGRGYALS